MIKASLNDYRQSPRKVRLVVDALRGKKVTQALSMLDFMVKDASGPIKKLLESAVANAKTNFSLDADGLMITEMQVNPGVTMKRSMPRARGSAFPIKKRTSHITLTLDVAPVTKVKSAKVVKTKK